MSTAPRSSPAEGGKTQQIVHPFGGCNKLLAQYQLIGSELLRYDRGFHRYSLSDDFDEFRHSVASVPVEVLESFLEDLLNVDVPEERLFISRGRFGAIGHWVALVGLLCSLVTGLFAVSTGASMYVAFALTVALSFPFGVLWHFAPRSGLVRRLAFAQILSHAIAVRRGGSSEDTRPQNSGLGLSSLLSPSGPTLQGAARLIYH